MAEYTSKYDLKQEVVVEGTTVVATVTGVVFYPDPGRIRYECRIVNNGNVQTVWFDEWELQSA